MWLKKPDRERKSIRSKNIKEKNMAIKNSSTNPMLKPSFIKFFKISLIAVVILLVVYIGASCMKDDQIDYSKSDFVQIKEPADNTDVVVFETSEGTFKAVLYEDEAPEYVKYFKKLVEDKYFDGTYVCSIIKNQDGLQAGFIGGSKTNDGTTAEDSNTEFTDLEVSQNLLPLKGAIGSLCSEKGIFTSAKAGSIVTFMNDVVISEELKESIKELDDTNGMKDVSNLFLSWGGVPNLMNQYTLFGQVFDGWEAYDKICSSEIVDEGKSDEDEDKNYQPISDIKFERVYLSTYGAEKNEKYFIPEKTETTTVSKSEK